MVLLKKEKYIDAIVGPQSYHKLNKTISQIEKIKIKLIQQISMLRKIYKLNLIKIQTVTIYLTIQEGCDKFVNFV